MVTKLNLQPHTLLGGQVEEGEGRLQGPPSHHKVSSPSNQAPSLGCLGTFQKSPHYNTVDTFIAFIT